MAANISLPALHVNPPEQQPNALEQYAKIMQLKQQQALMPGQLQQQQQTLQAGQLENQQRQQALKNVQVAPDVLKEWYAGGKDINALPQIVAKHGGTMDLANGLIKQQQDVENLTKDQRTNQLATNDALMGHIDAIKGIDDPTKRAQVAQSQAQRILQGGLVKDQQSIQMLQAVAAGQHVPTDDELNLFEKGLTVHSVALAAGFKEREVAAQEQTALGRKEQGDAALAKNAPLPAPQIGFMNKQLQNRYQVLNPGQQLPPEYTVPQGANRQQYEDIDKSLQSLETAATARQNRIQQQQQQGGARSDARSDKSYQFNSAQLEKVATPVDQAISRMSRLQDALAQNSPQADALIGPELLSVMAGGSGSGLRMNEAEISRVVGGRSKWETLKSSINQWQLDPSKATTITDEQRKEIRTLVSEVNSKLTKKQAILDDARQSLIGSDDPMQHRKIVTDARTKMTQIDQGAGAQPSGKITVTAPDGSVHPFDTQAQADAFKKLAHIQ